MRSNQGRSPLKIVALLILLLMLLAMVWAAYVSVAHWSGIGV
jgi:hypothetical protein